MSTLVIVLTVKRNDMNRAAGIFSLFQSVPKRRRRRRKLESLGKCISTLIWSVHLADVYVEPNFSLYICKYRLFPTSSMPIYTTMRPTTTWSKAESALALPRSHLNRCHRISRYDSSSLSNTIETPLRIRIGPPMCIVDLCYLFYPERKAHSLSFSLCCSPDRGNHSPRSQTFRSAFLNH